MVMNDTHMKCMGIRPPWVDGDFSLRIVLSQREAIDPLAFVFQPLVEVLAAYPQPGSEVDGGGVSGEGGWIVIDGAGLGNSADAIDRIQVGPHRCEQLSMLIAATRLRCMMPPGVGHSHAVQVYSVRNGVNAISDTTPRLRYAAPVVTTAAFIGKQEPCRGAVDNSSLSPECAFPRAAAYMLEENLELLLNVAHAGVSLTQWNKA